LNLFETEVLFQFWCFDMYKLSTRLLIVLLTFVIGISSAAGWYYYQESQKIQIILPNARWEQIFFNGGEVSGIVEGRFSINHVTKLAGLTELRKTSLKEGDVEIRVWRGFGLSPLEAVIIKRISGQWSAIHINHNNLDKVELKELSPPKSGWESLWKKIVEKEILTLRDSSEINCGEGGIDGSGYVVEINQDKTYRTYMLSGDYAQGKCREANQIEEIGDVIGEEFDSGIEQCTRAEWFACTKARKSNKQNQ
jgi:hypothetical protein